jgi:hypothetical protein
MIAKIINCLFLIGFSILIFLMVIVDKTIEFIRGIRKNKE